MSSLKKILFISFLTLIISVFSSAQIMQNEVEYNLASGVFDGTNLLIPTNLYSKIISYPDANSLRIKFNSVNLGRNSFIIVRSLQDDLWQKLNSESIEQWYNITAYLNGESLEISLFVGPGDHGIFFNISNLIVENEAIQTDDLCGSDNRTPSNNKAIGRIVKSNYDPCGTGWILFDGRIASAGHVLSGQSNLIIEFNVPDYYPGHPGPNDQYSINHSSVIKHNKETGDDWALMSVFPNSNTNLLPKEAQNAFFQVEQNTSTMTVRVTGYGIDDGSANYTQQTSTGPQTAVTGTTIWHSVDTRGANSGSPIINESNGKAIGIHTDGGCLDPSLQSNFGTSFTNTSLWNEINPEIDFTVYQKKNSGAELVGTYIGRWIGSQSSGSFQNYTVTVNGALIENLEYGDYETFRGKQEKTDDAPYEKFNTWSVENNPLEDVTNHQKFLIDYPMTDLTSNFNLTYSGVTIKNEFLEVLNLNPSNDIVEFKDPWLIDYEDPMYNGTNYRNRGMTAPFKSRTSPFYPNYDSYYGADKYIGVFLNQDPTFDPDIANYLIRSNSQQDIYLTQTGKTHRFYFQNWSGSPSNSASFENSTSNETGVVFSSGSATVSSKYKGTQLSNQTNAYSNTSQRRFLQTPDGVKHICYESMNRVWLEHSTDNGATWFLGNGGKPLSSADAKNPSMSFYGNQLGIVWQEKSGSNYFKIKMALFWMNDYSSSLFSTVADDDFALDYSYNANPVISWGYNGKVVVVWSGFDMCINLGNAALKYAYGNASSNGISWLSVCAVAGTDANSINPTIISDYTITSTPFYFHLAWQQNVSSSASKINYCKLYASGNDLVNTTFEEASLNSGYSKNYNPVILLRKVGASLEYIYITWLGYRVTTQEEALNKGNAVESGETRVLLKYKLGSSWSVTGVYGTSPVQNFSINKGTTITNNQEPLALCWSEPNGSSFYNKLMTSNSTGITTLNTVGRDMQINNGTTFSSMFANSFSSVSSPYSFNLSQNFGSINKENNLSIFNGREGVVGKDGAQFYFALGDIVVNGQNINFITIPDTTSINSLEIVNNYFESEPFIVNSSSNLTYGVQYGITDSALCSSALSGNEQIIFKVELLDNLTNEVLGVFDEITYTEQNVYQYNNIGYQMNLSGIDNRTVKFRLVTNTNGAFGYSLSNRTADQSILAKGKYQPVNYQGNLAVTEYSIGQNFPNPFNPSTRIKFQLPQDGFVTLKVYDILGNEITTLINEEKAQGRYEINFNASSLASGVYIYPRFVIKEKFLMTANRKEIS